MIGIIPNSLFDLCLKSSIYFQYVKLITKL